MIYRYQDRDGRITIVDSSESEYDRQTAGRSPNFPASQPKPKPTGNATIASCHLLAAEHKRLQSILDAEQAKAHEMSSFMCKAYGVAPIAKAKAATTTTQLKAVVIKDREQSLTDRLAKAMQRRMSQN